MAEHTKQGVRCHSTVNSSMTHCVFQWFTLFVMHAAALRCMLSVSNYLAAIAIFMLSSCQFKQQNAVFVVRIIR